MLIQDFHHVHNIGGVLLQIRVDDHREIPLRVSQTRQERRLFSEISREADHLDAVAGAGAESSQLLQSCVPAAVIDKNQFCLRHQIPEGLHGLLVKQIYIPFFVKTRNNH